MNIKKYKTDNANWIAPLLLRRRRSFEMAGTRIPGAYAAKIKAPLSKRLKRKHAETIGLD